MANSVAATIGGLAPKTKTPSGLSIKRNGATFTCSWKINDKDYGDGEVFHYFTNTAAHYSKVATVKTTSKAVSLNVNDWHPKRSGNYLTRFGFRVSGNRKAYVSQTIKTAKGTQKITVDPTQSDYAYKYMNILPPAAPALSFALDSGGINAGTFNWTVTNSADSKHWFTQLEWQSIALVEAGYSTGSSIPATLWSSRNAGWQTGTSSGNGSKRIEEPSSLIASGSITRWFRARARGPAGDSAWVYTKHVYARPYMAVVKSASVTVNRSGGYTCRVDWDANTNLAHPIDTTKVQYAFAQPESGMQCPDNPSWQDAGTVYGSGVNALTFSIDRQVGTDECLFVRVNTKHDSDANETPGTATFVTAGPLADPSITSVDLSQSTMRALVEAVNGSQVPDSFLRVWYFSSANPAGVVLGTIPHGGTSVTVQCPIADKGKAVVFGVQAVVLINSGGKSVIKMQSGIVKSAGDVPVAPANVSLAMTDIPGTIKVTFDWSWAAATNAELSWADHDDAWNSTDEPSTYVISNIHAAEWNISGLETGKKWYVRVRLSSNTGDSTTYGAYSDIQEIDLASAPAIPVLGLSTNVITADGKVTASWGFVSGDGTAQAFAELAEVSGNTYTPIAHAQTAQYITLDAAEMGWTAGETHVFAVRVVSASGQESAGWSDPVYLTIADPVTASIAETSLVRQTIIDDGASRTVNVLTQMPLMITVEGAGDNGTTIVAVERAESYHVSRPDETDFNGFEGETIALCTYTGEDQISIDIKDLLGCLDDGASYRIVAVVQDGFGQSAEDSVEFEVHWAHQAIKPDAKIIPDDSQLVTYLKPIAPAGALETDVCDIYRLSVDKPELIYPNAVFGQTYVDPYPAIGVLGGHRFVFKTASGDYITEGNEFAWVDTMAGDYGDMINCDANVIDFGSGKVALEYNIDLSNQWKKDFKETAYLGGSVQGDWNTAVSRTGSISGAVVYTDDPEMIEAMRRLAVYPGICHVRTKDGSSYSADVQVSESYSQDTAHEVVSFSLAITRVDPEGYDGMTLEEWENLRGEA